MLFGDEREDGENALERDPAARDVDETLVLAEGPVGEVCLAGFRLTEPLVVQEAAEEDAVREDGDFVFRADIGHAVGSENAPVEDGDGDLVGSDGEARVEEEEEMRGVGVGEGELVELGRRGGSLELPEVGEYRAATSEEKPQLRSNADETQVRCLLTGRKGWCSPIRGSAAGLSS